MIGLRAAAAKRVEQHLNGGRFSLPVVLIDEDGVEYSIRGSVLYDAVGVEPDEGAEFIHNEPIVILSIATLQRVPLSGENWFVKVPIIPDESAEKQAFLMSADSPLVGGKSLGFITLMLKKVDQI